MQKLQENFQEIVRTAFRSGLNPSSLLDRKKFNRLFAQTLGLSKVEADAESLQAIGEQLGLEEDGKFFVIDSKAKDFFDNLFAALHADCVNLICHKNLYEQHDKDLLDLGIISADLLEKFLRKNFNFKWQWSFFVLDEDKNRLDELEMRLKDRIYVTVAELEELFPYLPLKISAGIAEKYLNYRVLKNGDLLLQEQLDFDTLEWEREKAKIIKAVESDGYFFISQLELPESRAIFADLPEVVFKEVLNSRLTELGMHKWGQLIHQEGRSVSLPGLIGNFCRKAKSFNFESLEAQFGPSIKELRHLTDVLQNNALQLNKSDFVNIESLEFDIEKIDYLIQEQTQDLPIPVLFFKAFHCFPDAAGNAWNTYLLQSYVIHKSKKYGLIRPAPNNSCIGIIYNKSLFPAPEYHWLAAKKAKHDGIPPDSEILEKYVREKGFFSRVRKTTISNIIKYMNNGK